MFIQKINTHALSIIRFLCRCFHPNSTNATQVPSCKYDRKKLENVKKLAEISPTYTSMFMVVAGRLWIAWATLTQIFSVVSKVYSWLLKRDGHRILEASIKWVAEKTQPSARDTTLSSSCHPTLEAAYRVLFSFSLYSLRFKIKVTFRKSEGFMSIFALLAQKCVYCIALIKRFPVSQGCP
jgi:hypothetical protein